jgi:hypothetical protein
MAQTPESRSTANVCRTPTTVAVMIPQYRPIYTPVHLPLCTCTRCVVSHFFPPLV